MFPDYFPAVRRARGYFLYSTDGRRFLDFYQDKGRALLGHRPEGIQGIIKSTVSKGLISPYPSVYRQKAVRALTELFPRAVSIRLYGSKLELYGALASAFNKSIGEISPADPVFGDKGEISLWRPFLDHDLNGVSVLLPVIPCPEGFAPHAAVVLNREISLGGESCSSPLALNCFAKTIYRLIRTAVPPEERLRMFDRGPWDRRGIYLLFNIAGQKYADFSNAALNAGVLLPPDSRIPGIIPLSFEPGHIKGWKIWSRKRL